MRTVGRRWLAPIAAALLLLAGAVPSSAATATPGSVAASTLSGRSAPDDAVHAGRVDHGERAGVAEREVDGVAPTVVEASRSAVTVVAGRAAGGAVRRGAASSQPRAPPGSVSPIPS